jgi:hypothetical protein
MVKTRKAEFRLGDIMDRPVQDQKSGVTRTEASGAASSPYEPPAVRALGNVHELLAMAKSKLQDGGMCTAGPDPVCD